MVNSFSQELRTVRAYRYTIRYTSTIMQETQISINQPDIQAAALLAPNVVANRRPLEPMGK